MVQSWEDGLRALSAGDRELVSLWGEPGGPVRMVLRDPATGALGLIVHRCEGGTFPSVGLHHHPAIRLERAIAELFNLTPEGAADARPWLDHSTPYTFLPARGHGLHQIPVGPVHAGIIEPGHFRFTANGEAIVRLEARLGYVHKGTQALMAGADLARAEALAQCVSGDSVVAYALAFALAVEDALGVEAPPRAALLRALMAEMERVANHMGDIGMVCNDAAFPLMLAQCSAWKERALRAVDMCFGHRFMRGMVVPGGVAERAGPMDPRSPGGQVLRAFVQGLSAELPRLMDLYDGTASLQDRTVTTGVLRPAYARLFAAGGFVGRASGRDFDARRDAPYAPYDALRFSVPVRAEGDVSARVWVRFLEVEQSLALISQILDALEDGPAAVPLPEIQGGEEGAALVEGFRGDIFAWIRLEGGGRVGACHLRDPSWFQWPLLEVCVEGDIVADFPLCNKSFNCSYSGVDL